MKQLNYLIKPASGLCNMRCRYCFYADEMAVRGDGPAVGAPEGPAGPGKEMPDAAPVEQNPVSAAGKSDRIGQTPGIMAEETARILIRRTFEALDPGGSVQFSFQGGEPTLAGLSYFVRFTELVREYNARGCGVEYVLQTNGLGIDRDWADFLRREHFLVGVSMDGSRVLHDSLRPDAAGRATWDVIRRNLALLQERKVDVNLLTVVTKRCAKNPERIYRSLKELGTGYLQFIPCLDPLRERRGSQPWSLTPEDYGHFLCGLFDVWYRDWAGGEYVSVRLFDDYVHMAMGLPPGTCATGGACGAYLVAESDGTLYPCDFYCLDEWRLGNLRDAAPEAVLAGERERRFLAEGKMRPAECAACPWERLCHGGCRRDWVWEDEGTGDDAAPARAGLSKASVPGAQGAESGAASSADPGAGTQPAFPEMRAASGDPGAKTAAPARLRGCHNYYCAAFRRLFDYAGPRILRIAREELRYMRRG